MKRNAGGSLIDEDLRIGAQHDPDSMDERLGLLRKDQVKEVIQSSAAAWSTADLLFYKVIKESPVFPLIH
jgi:hypothetical protein